MKTNKTGIAVRALLAGMLLAAFDAAPAAARDEDKTCFSQRTGDGYVKVCSESDGGLQFALRAYGDDRDEDRRHDNDHDKDRDGDRDRDRPVYYGRPPLPPPVVYYYPYPYTTVVYRGDRPHCDEDRGHRHNHHDNGRHRGWYH